MPMPATITQERIREAFENSETWEWPTLAKRIMQYNEPILTERKENNRMAQAIFEAADEVDFAVYSIFQNHERRMH
jgi:hypothetical protein